MAEAHAIKTTPNSPAPPADLSATSKSWWASVVSTFELRDDETAILEAACRALDLASAARKERAGHLTVKGKFGPRQHPLIVTERDAVLLFSRLLRQLGLPPDAGPTEAPLVVDHGGGRRHA